MQTSKPVQIRRPAAREPTAAAGALASPAGVIDSADLLGQRREVRIRHKGAVYTLRETRQGKLILNK